VSPAPSAGLTLQEVVAQLAPAIGYEKSREVIAAAVQTLGRFDAEAVLELLTREPGLVGVAARFARTRKPHLAGQLPPPDPAPSSRSLEPEHRVDPPPKRVVPTKAIADLLANSLGAEASAEIVQQTVQRLGFDGAELDMPRAMKVLETMAKAPGLPGIAARFAKARVILLFK
jgi:hypothetical protein